MKLFVQVLILLVGVVFLGVPGAQAWSKEGHIMTCRIAQVNLSLSSAQCEYWLLSPNHLAQPIIMDQSPLL